jgi:hypothetical protein
MAISPAQNFLFALADVGGGNPVFFDIYPSPVPAITFDRSVHKKRTLTSVSGGSAAPGKSFFFDQGSDMSNGEMIIRLQDVYTDTYQLILNKFLFGTGSSMSPGIAMVWYTPNNNSGMQTWDPINVYELVWQKYPLLLPRGIDRYEGELHFFVNRQVQ